MPGSQHKKNDDLDEESRGGGFMEQKYKKDNEEKLDALANAASSIKQLSRTMGTQLEEEKEVQKQLDGGFVKTKVLIGQVMDSMDTMLN